MAEPACNSQLKGIYTPTNICLSLGGLLLFIPLCINALRQKNKQTNFHDSLLLDILVYYKSKKINLDRARHLLKRDFRFDNDIIESLLANI